MGGIMGGSNTAKQPTAVGTLQFQSAQRGGVIPLVYGACRVAPNMVDYDDFKSFMVNAQNVSKGKGGGGGGGGKSGKNQPQITEYSASFIMAVCQGAIGGTGLAWYDKFISGVAELDSISGLYFGADGQTPDPYWLANHGYKALGYSGTMTVVFANRNLGPSPTMPNFSFEVFAFEATAPNNIDCNPSDIIVDYLTNPRYGAGFPSANLDTASFDVTNPASYSSYVRALGLWMSISLETQQEAQQYLDNITKLTNSEVVWSGGLLKIIPRGETQVVGSITSNSSWTLTFSGGDRSGAQTISATISDPVLGTETATYTGFDGEHLSDFIGGFVGSLSGIVSNFNIIIASVVYANAPSAPPPSVAINYTTVVVSMYQSPPTGNTTISVTSAFTDPVNTTSFGGVGTYTPNNQAIYALGDDDFIVQESMVGMSHGPNPGGVALRSGAMPLTGGFNVDPVHVQRTSPADADNLIRLECLDRGAWYNSTIVEVSDQATIDEYGIRAQSSVNARGFADPSIAYTAAQLLLQRSLMYRNTYSFKLGWKYCLLEPMDLVQISDSRLGISALTVRITSVDEDEEGTLSITAEDYFGTYSPTVLYPAPGYVLPVNPTILGGGGGVVPGRNLQLSNQAFTPNFALQQGSVNTPIIFEPPPSLTQTQTALEIWIALSSPSTEWGGADIYMSLDGSSYALTGRIVGNSPMGVTTAPTLPTYGGTNPDTTGILAVNLTESRGTLNSVSSDVAANFLSLCYVGGELLSYETAALTGTNLYSLTTLYRGGYGSTIAAHTAGTAFAAIGSSIGRIPYPPSLIGQTVYFKFLSFNATFGGGQALSDVTAYSHVVSGAGLASSPRSWDPTRGNSGQYTFSNNNLTLAKTATTDSTAFWTGFRGSGKWTFSFIVTFAGTNLGAEVGFANANAPGTSGNYVGADGNGFGVTEAGFLIYNGAQIAGITGYSHVSGDRVDMTIDIDNKVFWIRSISHPNWNGNATFVPGDAHGVSFSAMSSGNFVMSPAVDITGSSGATVNVATPPVITGFPAWGF